MNTEARVIEEPVEAVRHDITRSRTAEPARNFVKRTLYLF